MIGSDHEKIDALLPVAELLFAKLKIWIGETRYCVSRQYRQAFIIGLEFRIDRTVYPVTPMSMSPNFSSTWRADVL